MASHKIEYFKISEVILIFKLLLLINLKIYKILLNNGSRSRRRIFRRIF